jgi:hypothetical protein
MEQNGATTGTTKRKQPPTSPLTDRPLKQIRPTNGIPQSPEETDDMDENDVQSVYSADESLVAPVAAAVHDTVRPSPKILRAPRSLPTSRNSADHARGRRSTIETASASVALQAHVRDVVQVIVDQAYFVLFLKLGSQ